MHECFYSCLVFMFTGKSRQILAPPATPGLLRDYNGATSMLSKTQNCDVRENNFKVSFQ